MALQFAGPIFRPTYRLAIYCVLVGLVGALTALAFDALVEFSREVLLGRVGTP